MSETKTEPIPFVLKYKPYFLADFGMDIHMKGALQTLLEMDDLNLLLYAFILNFYYYYFYLYFS